VRRRRYCQDCAEAVFHYTGSQIWVSCGRVRGWRGLNSVCVAEKGGSG